MVAAGAWPSSNTVVTVLVVTVLVVIHTTDHHRQMGIGSSSSDAQDAGKGVPFTDEQLEDYVDCTFFNKREIIKLYHVFQRYSKTKPDRITKDEFLDIPEIRYNPMRERIIAVFSQSPDGDIYFEDFLDFLSVFSLRSTIDVKASYMFRLYDEDNDGYLNETDLRFIIKTLTAPNHFSDEDVKKLLDKFFSEGDLDGDRQISYVEFEGILKKSQDFTRHARMEIE